MELSLAIASNAVKQFGADKGLVIAYYIHRARFLFQTGHTAAGNHMIRLSLDIALDN